MKALRRHDVDDEDEEDERPYVIENVKEVNIDKFKTKGTNYTVRFNNVMADDEIKNLHERLHYVNTFWRTPLVVFCPTIKCD